MNAGSVGLITRKETGNWEAWLTVGITEAVEKDAEAVSFNDKIIMNCVAKLYLFKLCDYHVNR
jgi:hypothetical protein